MSFRPELDAYLAHFGSTVPIVELHDGLAERTLLGLRHDVDHSLDLALELAWIESERGLRATYFLLTGHPYTQDDLFIDKCVQIQALGHEIGLHNDVITRWVRDEEAPKQSLNGFLQRLRSAGIQLRGTATHGDRECYVHGYLNSWCFAEARPAGRGPWNAEGLDAARDEEEITVPEGGAVEVDGRRLELWNLAMNDFGLDYEAHRVPVDRYYTDSGGSWRRSPDPLGEKLDRERVQVLMHPEWWAAKRRIFFLSTARSGSKWLANLIDRSTSSVARHEFSLNHAYQDGELQTDKKTGEDFRTFIRERELIRARLRESAAWVGQLHEDFTEANVYLAHCVDELRETFPEAEFVHLHRDGRDVVRSLLNRSWYDTPEDDRHPELEVEGWDSLRQLEKCCWYWTRTNQAISTLTGIRLPLERAASDPSFMTSFLRDLGVRVTLPEVFAHEHALLLNESYATDMPHFSEWSEDEQRTFAAICGSEQTRLGYPAPPAADGGRPHEAREYVPTTLMEHRFEGGRTEDAFGYKATRCSLEPSDAGLAISVPAEREGHATVHLGDGSWNRPGGDVFRASRSGYYRLEIEADLGSDLTGTAHVLFYDAHGRPVRSPHRRSLRPGLNAIRMSFWPPGSSRWFTFGLSFHETHSGLCVVRSVRLLAFREAGEVVADEPAVGIPVLEHRFAARSAPTDEYRAVRCTLDARPGGCLVRVDKDKGGHATVHLGGGVLSNPDRQRLLPVDRSVSYRLDIDAELSHGLEGSVHVRFYDEEGRPVRSPVRRQLERGRNLLRLRFGPPDRAQLMTFALFFHEDSAGECLLRFVRLGKEAPTEVAAEPSGDMGRLETDEFFRTREGFGYTED